MKSYLKIVLSALLLAAVSNTARADDVIQINGQATHLIPIMVTGFSGEADSVLKFDLAVLGLQVSSAADYVVSGKNAGRVEGTLSQGGRAVFVRSYSGGSVRSQAHALANDVIKELRQTTPIFQTRIAFRLARGTSTEICVSDYDGYNPVVMTRDGAPVSTPAWLPHGSGLLYTSWMRGNTEIYEQNLSSGSRRVFAGFPGLNFNAEVAPDGQKVAMILSKGGSPNLYICDINGGGVQQLTHTREEDSSPCWSADSQEICFACRMGRPELQKINVRGGSTRRVPVAGVYGNLTSPDWSPDGRLIAFTSGSGNFTICVVPAEGGEAERLVSGEDPSWSPNSRTLIFTQRRGDKRVLCLLDVPTKHVKDIRQISGSCSEPSWAR